MWHISLLMTFGVLMLAGLTLAIWVRPASKSPERRSDG